MSKKIVFDPIHGHIECSQLEKLILESKLFSRLHNITQTSTAYFTFPALKHTRYLHSVGVMHIASKMFRNLIINSDDIASEYFNAQKNEFLEILKLNCINQADNNTGRMLNNNQDINIDTIIKKDLIEIKDLVSELPYKILLESVRIAALLHDVGHMPFSHLMEDVIKEITVEDDVFFEYIKNKRNYTYEEFKNEKIEWHEELGNDIVKCIFDEILSQKEAGADKATICLIKEIVLRILNDKSEYKHLHYLVANVVDADRLDYLVRDSLFSGLSKPYFDLELATNLYKLNKNNVKSTASPSEQREVSDSDKLKNNVESTVEPYNIIYKDTLKTTIDTIDKVVESRFNLYKETILHQDVMLSNYLLEEILIYAYKDNKIDSNQNGYFLQKNLQSGLQQVFNAIQQENNIDLKNVLISQFDEVWLLSILKDLYAKLWDKKYSQNTSENKMTDKDETTMIMLEDILYGTKHYEIQPISLDDRIDNDLFLWLADWLYVDKKDDASKQDLFELTDKIFFEEYKNQGVIKRNIKDGLGDNHKVIFQDNKKLTDKSYIDETLQRKRYLVDRYLYVKKSSDNSSIENFKNHYFNCLSKIMRNIMYKIAKRDWKTIYIDIDEENDSESLWLKNKIEREFKKIEKGKPQWRYSLWNSLYESITAFAPKLAIIDEVLEYLDENEIEIEELRSIIEYLNQELGEDIFDVDIDDKDKLINTLKAHKEKIKNDN